MMGLVFSSGITHFHQGVTNLQKSREEMVAYFAGFFDGEGCVRLNKQGKYYTLKIAITQTPNGLKSLEIFREMFGGNIYHTKPRSPQQQETFSVELFCEKAKQALREMLPYLRVKRAQAQIAIKKSHCEMDYLVIRVLKGLKRNKHLIKNPYQLAEYLGTSYDGLDVEPIDKMLQQLH